MGLNIILNVRRVYDVGSRKKMYLDLIVAWVKSSGTTEIQSYFIL